MHRADCACLRVAIVCLLGAIVAACGESRSAARPAFSQRDSAGITIAESATPEWTAPAQGWHLADTAEWVIGAQGLGQGNTDQVPLSRVVSVIVLPGGRVLLGNDGSQQLLLYDSLGRLERTLSGPGDGPGELRVIRTVFPCRGDTIVVQQVYSLDVFDVKQGFVRRLSTHDGRPASVRAAAPDCRRFVRSGAVRLPPPGEHGALLQTVMWVDTAFTVLDTVAVDSVPGVFTVVNQETANDELYPKVPPWTADVPLIAADTFVVRGHAIRPELQWLWPDGRIQRIVRWRQLPVPVTNHDRALYTEKRRFWLAHAGSNPVARSMLPDLDDWHDVPRIKPFFDKIRVDDEGDVWVLKNSLTQQLYEHFPPVEPEPPERWMIFTPSGRWLGELEMPERFQLHAVTSARVYGVAKDSLDVETVRAYRILK
ncbi:MAG TPA: hypothetical protein VFK13_10510 [Gemmatimonadaceae bacterium]|nr:hypothetical protein [Gemmatimonadaceae bacterium]